MVVRRRKKKIKLRGQRTHGKGNTKNRRGAGCRGGRGKAGSHKHKYSKYYLVFGTKRKLKPKRKERAINLDELNKEIEVWVREKKVEKEKGLLIIDGKKLGLEKILSVGNIDEKVLIRNLPVSKKAKEKIEKAGGIVEEEKSREKAKEGVGKIKEKGPKDEKKGESSEEEIVKSKQETANEGGGNKE